MGRSMRKQSGSAMPGVQTAFSACVLLIRASTSSLVSILLSWCGFASFRSLPIIPSPNVNLPWLEHSHTELCRSCSSYSKLYFAPPGRLLVPQLMKSHCTSTSAWLEHIATLIHACLQQLCLANQGSFQGFASMLLCWCSSTPSACSPV